MTGANHSPMDDPVKELDQILRECDLKVAVGLRAQGHMPTVEQMLRDGKTWDEIGAAIHWHGPTVRDWWSREVLVELAELSRLRAVTQREFTNELGNRIRITIEGPSSIVENVLTPMEVAELRAALDEHHEAAQ